MQFPETLSICKDVLGPQYLLVLGVSIDWHPGWLLGWHAPESGSLGRGSGEVGDIKNVKKYWKATSVGSIGIGARTSQSLGVSFCHCRFCWDLGQYMASEAIVCDLERREEIHKREGTCVSGNSAVTTQEYPAWPGAGDSIPETDKRQLLLKKRVGTAAPFPVSDLGHPAPLASFISLCNIVWVPSCLHLCLTPTSGSWWCVSFSESLVLIFGLRLLDSISLLMLLI